MPYREGLPVPQGYHLETKRSDGLVYGGLALWGIPYTSGLVVAAANGFDHGTGWLLVPVAGPFIGLGSREINCNLDRFETDPSVELKDLEEQCLDSAIDEVTAVAFLTASGLFQTSGVLLLVAGLATSEEQLVRDDVSKVAIHPVVGPGQMGLIATGRF